jgi:Asp-tRNA(Asn)/Glu-tRNA(Gln) amidotransferase A subunit family amidase
MPTSFLRSLFARQLQRNNPTRGMRHAVWSCAALAFDPAKPSHLMTLPIDIVGLRHAVRTGVVTPSQAIQQAFERAHATQPYLKAFAHLPQVLQVAESDPAAPLAGIAVAMKDLIDTADMPTTYGSPIYQGHFPQRDAWIVERLRGCGAHVLGKSVTTEFAWRHPGLTVNPWNAQHTPGGSSSGSAAAVAAGIVSLGIGTQTLGSVIRPAAYCGIVGFKPSFGGISRTGICPLASSLDHVGLFTRSVGDAAYVFRLVTGKDSDDIHGDPLSPVKAEDVSFERSRPPRIGLLQSDLLGDITIPQASLMHDVAERFRSAGAIVIEANLPSAFAEAADVTVALVAYEAAQHHRGRIERFAPLLSQPMTALIEQGRAMSSDEYAALKERQATFRQVFAQWLTESDIDVLCMPPATGEAPQGLAYTGDPRFCSPITLLGVPTITLPAGFGAAGLPLGVQLVGSAGQDGVLLSAALWCEDALDYPIRFPDFAF